MHQDDPTLLASFRPTGAARFVLVGFLGFWLCGWVAGEAAAVGLLVSGAWAMTRNGVAAPIEGGLAGGLFLLLWLGLWTAGGVAAWFAFFRMVLGRDDVRTDGEALLVERRTGPYVERRRLPFPEVVRIGPGRGDAVVAELVSGERVTLTALGGKDEREAFALSLSERLGLGVKTTARDGPPAVPAGYELATDAAGDPALVRPARWRLARTGCVAVFAVPVAAVALVRLEQAATGVSFSAGHLGVIAGLALLALALAAGLVWAAFAEEALVAQPGALVRRRRLFDWTWERTIRPLELEVTSSRDSDGDDWFELVATGGGGPLALASGANDPGPTVHLGRWCSYHTGARLRIATAANAL